MSISYQPIACSLHDEYEIAIMHKKPISIKWQDDEGVWHRETVLAKDIQTKNKEEFLVALNQDDREIYVRLDKVTLLK